MHNARSWALAPANTDTVGHGQDREFSADERQANMPSLDIAWEQRLAALWSNLDSLDDTEFVAQMAALTSELPAADSVALFERAAAWDSTGHPEEAVPLYEAALSTGLSGIRRRRATIQLASSLRNLGQAARAAEMLQRELNEASDELTQAVQAFLALALADLGRDREALAIALNAVSHYLPRYNRSLARYAEQLQHEGA